MAVAFRSATSIGNSAPVTSAAPAVPSGAAANDIAVIILDQWSSTASTPVITPPSGFTQKDSFTSSNGKAKNSIWWKRLTGSDTGTYSYTFTASFWTTAECMLFTGCVTTGDPFDGTAVNNTGSTGTFATLTMTTTDSAGGLIWGCYNDNPGTHTPPTSFTEAIDDDCGSCAYFIPGTSGSQSAANATVSSTGPDGAWLGALLSTAGGGASPPVYVPTVAPSLAAISRSSTW